MKKQHSSNEMRPPRTEVGILGWLKKNLFSTWYNIVLSIIAIIVLYLLLNNIIRWVLFEARWEVVAANIKVFLVGRYPTKENGRIFLSLFIVITLSVLTWLFRKKKSVRRWIVVGWLVSFPVIGILLVGFVRGGSFMPLVSESMWGGLLLTLILAITAIVVSFPLGILLAIGRRSKLPVIRIICTVYIETIRGVPLISILFMSQLMLPLFLPPQIRLGTVLRALTGITLFSAAYTAENIRGGLASVPIGQYDAAKALGLNKVLMLVFVILPQAIRVVIPAIVGQFISLFKDTTLVVIVGLLELLGIAKSVTAQKEFIGLHMEVYCFVALIFFICCYSMSSASKRLEEKLGVGKR